MYYLHTTSPSSCQYYNLDYSQCQTQILVELKKFPPNRLVIFQTRFHIGLLRYIMGTSYLCDVTLSHEFLNRGCTASHFFSIIMVNRLSFRWWLDVTLAIEFLSGGTVRSQKKVLFNYIGNGLPLWWCLDVTSALNSWKKWYGLTFL